MDSFANLLRACTCESDPHNDPSVLNSSDHSYTSSTHPNTPNPTSSSSPSSSSLTSQQEVINHLVTMHYNMGCNYQEEGNLEAAISCYKNALNTDHLYCDAQYNLANALQLSGRIREAEEEYKKTINLNPHHQLAYYNLGYLYFNDLKDPWKGIEMLKKSLEIDPNDVDAQINMALALNDLGMLDDVIKCYRYIIEHNSNCVMAHFNLGNAYLDVGNIEEALNCFQVCFVVSLLFVSLFFSTDLLFNSPPL